MTQTVLLIEDERKIAQWVRAYLEGAGFRVLVAHDGGQGLEMVRRDKPDLVILDLMLPGMDGLDVCRVIRRGSDLPIIMVTARAEEVDRLIGLELGADDYVTKPFSARELVARVRAVLRRSAPGVTRGRVLIHDDLVLDLDAHTLTQGGRGVELTPMEFGLLAALMQSAGRVLSRGQLLDATQGDEYPGYERTIDAHIRRLRRKLQDGAAEPRYVQTVYGVGYRLGGPGGSV